MDPTQPLDVIVRIDSPQVVAYRLWWRPPGGTDEDWTKFATGDDQSPNPSTWTVGPLPRGSDIRWFALIDGNPQTAYRIAIGFEQGGRPVADPALLTGTTDGDGAASARGEVTP